jgi:hypothetical protein
MLLCTHLIRFEGLPKLVGRVEVKRLTGRGILAGRLVRLTALSDNTPPDGPAPGSRYESLGVADDSGRFELEAPPGIYAVSMLTDSGWKLAPGLDRYVIGGSKVRTLVRPGFWLALGLATAGLIVAMAVQLIPVWHPGLSGR